MTAKPSQTSRPRRGSNRRVALAGPMAVAAACVTLCVGCERDSVSGYREYTGNGKSQESLIVKENATPENSKPRQDAADEKSSSTQSKAVGPQHPTAADPSRDAAIAIVARKPEALPDAKAASVAAATTVAMAEMPAVAQKPTLEKPASQSRIGAAQAAIASPPIPRQPKVLVKERQFQVAGPAGAIRVSYDDIDMLKVINMDPVTPDALSLIPNWLKSVEGKRVRLRGFMYPANSQTGLPGFSLARDNQICCFGRLPKWYDVFPVQLREGVTTDYISGRPFDVVGVFHFLTDPEDWPVHGMYFIDDAIVIDK